MYRVSFKRCLSFCITVLGSSGILDVRSHEFVQYTVCLLQLGAISPSRILQPTYVLLVFKLYI